MSLEVDLLKLFCMNIIMCTYAGESYHIIIFIFAWSTAHKITVPISSVLNTNLQGFIREEASGSY